MLLHAFLLLVLALGSLSPALAFGVHVPRSRVPRRTTCCSLSLALSHSDLVPKIRSIAKELWGDQAIPILATSTDLCSGEAPFVLKKDGQDYSQRVAHFEALARQGDPCAQHSLGLLLWSGYHCPQDAIASAQWHAAAALQNHLDGMAVLGGCLRTGTGVPKANVALGLQLIDYSASQGNPTGINKKAALEEVNGNFETVFQLYYNQRQKNPNALLLFNLGWCYVHGEGTAKDVVQGEELWKEATQMAPDEGSEEAAWLLYLQYKRDNPREAQQWLELATNLGYQEALEELGGT